MESNNFFSLNRVVSLFKRQINLNYKPWLIAISAISGLLLVVSLYYSYRTNVYSPQALTTLGTIVLFIGGYIFTSQSFSELNDRIRGFFYLTLPASTFEKFLVSWLISSVGFTAIIFSMLVVVSLLASGISSWYVDTNIQIIDPFNKTTLKNAGIYLVTQSIFFLGAVYFKKFNFLKTLLALFVIYIGLSIWSSLFVYVLFYIMDIDFFMLPESDINVNINLLSNMSDIAKYLFWGFLGPYFLAITYIRMNEREL